VGKIGKRRGKIRAESAEFAEDAEKRRTHID
jgi:hypothetical protein